MSIYVADNKATLCRGDYHPAALFRGENRITGWDWSEKSGESLEWEHTYNDTLHASLVGRSEQEIGADFPSPSHPSPIHSAGNCELISSNGGTLSSSIAIPVLSALPNGVADTLTDLGGGWWRWTQNIGVKVFDGTEAWYYFTETPIKIHGLQNCINAIPFDGNMQNFTGRCSHFAKGTGDGASPVGTWWYNAAGIHVRFSYAGTTNEFKAFLAAQHAAGTPVTVQYQLATPIITDLHLGELKTFPRYTRLEQDGSVLAQITARARVAG